MSKSKFSIWFEMQFGKRSNKNNLSDKQLEDKVMSGLQAEQELVDRQIYDAKRLAALYAWQVNEK